MKLWLLRPVSDGKGSPWHPWYDKAFGFIVRAETEQRARELAQAQGGDEVRAYRVASIPAWTDPTLSTCVEVTTDGEQEVVLCDFRSV